MSATTEGSANFAEKSTRFVLKLRLVGVGGAPQIRRVKLPRITVGGSVSFDALVGVAISYTFPGAPLVPEDYDVVLTYYDVDNDCVTIASTEELLDAIDQFKNNPVLRVTTDVKRKKSRPFTPPESPRCSSSRAATVSPSDHDGKQTTAQIQNVLESFVTAVGTAVLSLQNHVNNNNNKSCEYVRTVETATTAKAAASINQTEATNSSTAEEEQAAKECVEDTEMDKEEATDATQAKTPEVPPRPFIHGRHTCDGCLCTPIIGKRFHATNLPDYDLCARCRDNYKGTEIVFEAAELERDGILQERWHRKRERWSNQGGPGGPRGQGMPRRQLGRRGGAPCTGFRRGPRVINRGRCHWNQSNNNMDDALKEAIRRSMSDVNVDPTEQTTETDESTQTSPAPEEPAAPSPTPSAPAEELIVADIAQSAPIAKSVQSAPEESLVLPPAPTRAPEPLTPASPPKASEPEDSFSSDAKGNGDIAEEIGLTLDQCARAITDMMSELDRHSFEMNEMQARAAGNSDDEISTVASQSKTNDANENENENEGQSIIDGEENDASASVGSEDEWQVVVDNDQTAGDAALARAAQMIGSALFESEVNGTADASTLTNSDDFSVPSSVPTDHASEISSAVTDRWSVQLSQLHELGFVDDVKSVEILERLHAANVGVDSDEEVTVAQVVSELFGR